MVAAPTELLWAFIGLTLTIIGTFVGASIASPPWEWGHYGLQSQPLGVTYQVGAVLLVSCMGGRNAGVLSQIAYLVLGLVGFPVFTHGSGLDYLREPTFGYLLGFIPGAWVCGTLSCPPQPPRTYIPVRLEGLTFSGLCGLVSIHITGLVYLTAGYLLDWLHSPLPPLLESFLRYSVYPLPGQLALVCAVAVLAFVLRRLMFY